MFFDTFLKCSYSYTIYKLPCQHERRLSGKAADFLVEIMPVMFVPAGVGLLEAWGDLQPIWLPVVIITILTTVIVMVITGRSTQFVIRKDRGKDKK